MTSHAIVRENTGNVSLSHVEKSDGTTSRAWSVILDAWHCCKPTWLVMQLNCILRSQHCSHAHVPCIWQGTTWPDGLCGPLYRAAARLAHICHYYY